MKNILMIMSLLVLVTSCATKFVTKEEVIEVNKKYSQKKSVKSAKIISANDLHDGKIINIEDGEVIFRVGIVCKRVLAGDVAIIYNFTIFSKNGLTNIKSKAWKSRVPNVKFSYHGTSTSSNLKHIYSDKSVCSKESIKSTLDEAILEIKSYL